MKKITAIILAAVISISIAACNKQEQFLQEPAAEEVVSQIYVVADSDYMEGGWHNTFHYENVISDKFSSTQELPRNTKKTVIFEGKDCGLTYVETDYHPIGDRKLHQFSIDGAEESYVLFNEGGELVSILRYPFAKVDIEPNDSPETVRAALEPAIADWIDLSQFQYIEAHTSVPHAAGEPFVKYWFVCYRMCGEYLTRSAIVTVSDNGVVDCLRGAENCSDEEEICAKIDKEVEAKLILEKLKSIYDTEETAYLSHDLYDSYFSKRLVRYNGEMCIKYFQIDCEVYMKEEETTESFCNTLLIPVRLLCGTGSEVIKK